MQAGPHHVCSCISLGWLLKLHQAQIPTVKWGRTREGCCEHEMVVHTWKTLGLASVPSTEWLLEAPTCPLTPIFSNLHQTHLPSWCQ